MKRRGKEGDLIRVDGGEGGRGGWFDELGDSAGLGILRGVAMVHEILKE